MAASGRPTRLSNRRDIDLFLPTDRRFMVSVGGGLAAGVCQSRVGSLCQPRPAQTVRQGAICFDLDLTTRSSTRGFQVDMMRRNPKSFRLPTTVALTALRSGVMLPPA